MPWHVKPYDNQNQPVVGPDDERLPRCYFNRLLLKRDESFSYRLKDYESACVLITGTCTITVNGEVFESVGQRTHLWEGRPDSVYAPRDSLVELTCQSDEAEVYVAGGRTTEDYAPFRVTPDDVQKVQYGSDDTKTHRKIFHVLGQNANDRAGNLLVSELFTVGAGGWSGFPPHKHDEDRPGVETAFEEFYRFRFNPSQGFAAQFNYVHEDDFGPVHHVKDGSNVLIDGGYHPVVVAPGYEMYYFTIIVGHTTRSLVQFFEPAHAAQVETIPGIKDMIAKFK
jgi:5-deoxy-glucuronate isomerase